MLGTFNLSEDYRVTGFSRNGQDCYNSVEIGCEMTPFIITPPRDLSLWCWEISTSCTWEVIMNVNCVEELVLKLLLFLFLGRKEGKEGRILTPLNGD